MRVWYENFYSIYSHYTIKDIIGYCDEEIKN